MSDEPGVLGNLPRARPGRRSAKRAQPRPTAATRPKRSSSVKAAPAAKVAARRSPAPERPAERAAAAGRPATDPLSEAVRIAAKVAGIGVSAAGGVLRRLPGR